MSRPAHQPSVKADAQLPAISAQMQGGDHAGASDALRLLAADAPNDGRVYDLLSTCQAVLAQRGPATSNARRALELMGDDPGTVARCAAVLQRAGEYDEALLHVERVLYKHRDPGLLRLRTFLLIDLGKDRPALKSLRELRKLVPANNPNAALSMAILNARLAPGVVDAKSAVSELEPWVGNSSCAPRTRAAGAFQLGRLREHLGEYDEAFDAFSLGKSIGKPPWDPDAHSARIDRLIDCWTSPPSIEPAPVDGSGLVFIVGMMRSGTSLTEQMIAQCDAITPGDELSIIEGVVARIEQSAEQPRLALSRDRYTQAAINEYADKAREAYSEHFAGSLGTDKQPENFYHLPLIARLFPGCKIVHCTRDPLDCCVSNFVQSFAAGFPHTHDLAWLGRYHRDYQRVMDAWRSLPEIEMLEIAYEDLVAEPETQTRLVADHLGLVWTDRVLRFHESKRTLKTASREQVRSAINSRSVARHERFAAHLAPLREALGLG